jgi:hypothetical protein
MAFNANAIPFTANYRPVQPYWLLVYTHLFAVTFDFFPSAQVTLGQRFGPCRILNELMI